MIYIVLNNSPFYQGGVEQVVANLLVTFDKKLTKSIILICSDDSKPKEFKYQGYKCVNLITNKHKIFDVILLKSQLLYSYKIFNYLKNRVKEQDMINIHGIEYAFFPSLLKKLFKNKVTILVTCHGSYFDRYQRYINNLPKKFFIHKILIKFWKYYYFLIESLIIKNVDKFIFITNYLADFYKNTYKIKSNYVTIPNGLKEVDNFSERVNKDIDTALIIGSSYYLKGLDIAIEAVRIINNEGKQLTLRIVGFKDIKLKKEPFIKYVGSVVPTKIHEEFNKSNFLLLPSRDESFPMVVLESISNKKPILISKEAAKAKINYSSVGKVIQGYSIDKWVKGIRQLMDSKNYERYSKSLSTINIDNFKLNNVGNAYLSVFKSYI